MAVEWSPNRLEGTRTLYNGSRGRPDYNWLFVAGTVPLFRAFRVGQKFWTPSDFGTRSDTSLSDVSSEISPLETAQS